MHYLTILLFVYILAMPVYGLWEGDKTKRKVLSNKLSKVGCYQQTIMYLWLPTLFLISLMYFDLVPWSQMGLTFELNNNQLIAYAVLAVMFAYILVSANSIQNNEQQQLKIKQHMADFNWLMPSDKKQLNWFVWGVSLSAGVCEELLFRGFLLYFLTDYVELPLAVLISTALFALCHSYQGWQNALKTGGIGLILALTYLWTGSLFVAILLHFAIDMYAGLLYYAAVNPKQAK